MLPSIQALIANERDGVPLTLPLFT
jgi:hypothetical protein